MVDARSSLIMHGEPCTMSDIKSIQQHISSLTGKFCFVQGAYGEGRTYLSRWLITTDMRRGRNQEHRIFVLTVSMGQSLESGESMMGPIGKILWKSMHLRLFLVMSAA